MEKRDSLTKELLLGTTAKYTKAFVAFSHFSVYGYFMYADFWQVRHIRKPTN